MLAGALVLAAQGVARGDSAAALPSLCETGRAAPMPLEGTEITPAVAAVADSRERPIQPQVPEPRIGEIDPDTLSDELHDHLSTLRDCVIETARQDRVPASRIVADTMTLRFSIEPTGKVTAVEVVARADTDADVVACVQSDVKEWTFTRPRGGPVAVERIYRFPSKL